ncbi:MAG: MFS transporter [Bauldia sp.]
MVSIAIEPAEAQEKEAKYNALVLSVAQAVSGSLFPIAISLGGLTGSYLLGPDKSLATLPVTALNVGLALGTIPAAMLMRRIGRRSGFMGGAVSGVVGGVVSCIGILHGSFLVFAIGMLVAGFSGAFAQQYRFAAIDSGSEAFRARAISWVLAGGLVGGVVGPQTAIFSRNLFAPIPFAGAFLAMAGLALIAIFVLAFLTGRARRPPMAHEHSGGRPLGEIVRQPRFIVAVICGVGSYALMSLVMTAAPLAMVACGLGEDNAALGIQWHVLAMFAPSFITGPLMVRFGKEPVMAAGMLILGACAIVGLTGIDLAHFWIALILLGLGWNFAFIGATAFLTTTYRPEERSKVQGFNDFLVFGSVAVASLSSGKLLNSLGWDWINWIMLPVVAICLVTLGASHLAGRRQPG